MVEWDGLALLGESACDGKIVVVQMNKNDKGFVYVLRCYDQKWYIGSTRDLNKRLEAHKMGRVKTTKSRRPIRLVYSEQFDSYKEACQRELYLKSGAGREWLKEKLERCQSG